MPSAWVKQTFKLIHFFLWTLALLICKLYVVDADLSKFFDRIHHDQLIARMGQSLTDKRILRLVGIMLHSGVMINGVVNPSKEGVMQGSPLTP